MGWIEKARNATRGCAAIWVGGHEGRTSTVQVRMEWGKETDMRDTAEVHVTQVGYCLDLGCESWEE